MLCWRSMPMTSNCLVGMLENFCRDSVSWAWRSLRFICRLTIRLSMLPMMFWRMACIVDSNCLTAGLFSLLAATRLLRRSTWLLYSAMALSTLALLIPVLAGIISDGPACWTVSLMKLAIEIRESRSAIFAWSALLWLR